LRPRPRPAVPVRLAKGDGNDEIVQAHKFDSAVDTPKVEYDGIIVKAEHQIVAGPSSQRIPRPRQPDLGCLLDEPTWDS
jgi:hypothetical protein